jgi:hypothetical protein
LLSAPTTDPHVPNSGIRFLPRVVEGKASVEVGLDSCPLLPSRTPSRPCDALSWLRVQSVSPGFACPSVPPLAPPPSASQLLWRSLTSRVRSSPATASHLPDKDRRDGKAARPGTRSPGSLNTESSRTCQGLRPRRTGGRSRNRASPILPSAVSTASASGTSSFRGSIAGLCAPLTTLRTCPRGQARTAWGATWFATPSSQWTSTFYSLPVSPAPLTLYSTPI